jgi:predicted metal-binding membrane protein
VLPFSVARGRWAPAVAVGAVAVAAWVVLWFWERSSYAAYLDHGELDHVALDGVTLLAVYVAGWSVMVAAMMLPTTLPLVMLFAGITKSRSNRSELLALVVVGYLVVWVTFGLLVYTADLGLHALVDQVHGLHENEWIIPAMILAVAGVYQFSELKYRCQQQCRSPRMFLIQRWGSGRERRRSWRIGLEHGLFCVGCCWTLMLVMFAIGTFSLAAMLAVGAVMAAEKNLPGGKELRAPLGVGLSLAAVALTATQLL